MKRTLWTAALAACTLTAAAQEESAARPLAEAGRIFRTEVVPYNARHDADARNRQAGGYWMEFRPELITRSEGEISAFYGAKIDIPFEWTDGRVFPTSKIRAPATRCGSTTGPWPRSTIR